MQVDMSYLSKYISCSSQGGGGKEEMYKRNEIISTGDCFLIRCTVDRFGEEVL